MKLIKLTELYFGNEIFINSDCILSCERTYHNEFQLPYTKVGLLYKDKFTFFQVSETICDIQSQLAGKPAETKVEVDKKLVGRQIRKIRREKGMTLEEFGKMFGANKSNVAKWEQGQHIPCSNRLKEIADFAGITVQYLLEG